MENTDERGSTVENTGEHGSIAENTDEHGSTVANTDEDAKPLSVHPLPVSHQEPVYTDPYQYFYFKQIPLFILVKRCESYESYDLNNLLIILYG